MTLKYVVQQQFWERIALILEQVYGQHQVHRLLLLIVPMRIQLFLIWIQKLMYLHGQLQKIIVSQRKT